MMNRIYSAVSALLMALAVTSTALGQSTINTGQPATDANLNSLVMRQQFTAAASDINGLLSKHPATSTSQCPPTPFLGEDCLTVGQTPFQWLIWTGGTGGWAEFAFFSPNSGKINFALTNEEILNAAPITTTFNNGAVTIGLNIDSSFLLNGSNQLALNSISAGDLLCNSGSSTAEPGPCTWNTFASKAISTTGNTFPIFTNGAWGTKTLGTSVTDPGTGSIEGLLPVQLNTSGNGPCNTACNYASSDFFKKTRRSNGGVSMSDTLPPVTASGLVNGTRIVLANADATATLTVNAGAGTIMASGGSSDTIGPGRDVAYEYDVATTQWRGSYNTRTVLLGPNNLSDLSSIPTARGNLIPANSLALSQFPTIGADTVLGSIAGGTPIALTQAQLISLINGFGVPTNTRSAYTAANSLATTDCGKTVALGGSAFYTFTVNAASGYNSSCAVDITNEDNVCPTNGASTCRGKLLAINGYANFILWPGQTFKLINQNNVWQYDQPGRWQPLVGMTWHVNHATGQSTPGATDGLGTSGTGEFRTLQQCVNVVESLTDFGQADVGPTCQNDAETFTENNVVHTHPLTGYHVISITGDPTSPTTIANHVWQVSGSGNTGMQCRDTGLAIITGFDFVSTGTGNNFIQAGQLAVCDFGSIIFGGNPGGSDIHLTQGGSANFFGGTLSITGSMNSWVSIDGEGHFLSDGAAITMPNALAYSAFVIMSGPGDASMTSMTFSGAGSAGGSTGAQSAIASNSSLSVSGTTLPGSTGPQITPQTVAAGGTGDTGTAWSAYTLSPSCGTATFTITSARNKQIGKTVFMEFDITVTAIGTCAATVNVNLPATAQSGSGLSGRESVATGKGFNCGILASGTIAACNKADVTALAVNERYTVSGVYERQ